jgi:hypothetical protein
MWNQSGVLALLLEEVLALLLEEVKVGPHVKRDVVLPRCLLNYLIFPRGNFFLSLTSCL